MDISNQLNNEYLKIWETRSTIFVTYSKKVILENLEDRTSFYRKFEKACERFKKRKNTNACNLSSSFKTVDKRRLEKKLKTAVESDEKREMTKETKWNGGGSESGKKLKKEGEWGRELNLSDKQENPR